MTRSHILSLVAGVMHLHTWMDGCIYVCEWIDECMHVICECIDEWIVSDRVMSISMVQMMMMLMMMMIAMMMMLMIEMMMMMMMMMSMYKRSPLNILANSWHCGTSAIDEMNPVDIISTNRYHE